MGRHATRALHLAATAVLAAASSFATAQSAPATAPANTTPCTTSPQPQPCTTPKPAAGQATPADRFPFPGEQPAKDTTEQPAPRPAAENTSPAPAADAPSTDAPAAGKRFPFPGEDPASSPAGSSSSSSSADPTQPTDPDAAPDASKPDATPGRRLLKRVNPIGTKLQSTDDRVAEDLDVAKFYTQTGDLQGAYLRSQDAVKLAPDDPDAHCSLAETALKLNKRDQAVAEFNTCLKLDPEEKLAKNARKQLAKLK